MRAENKRSFYTCDTIPSKTALDASFFSILGIHFISTAFQCNAPCVRDMGLSSIATIRCECSQLVRYHLGGDTQFARNERQVLASASGHCEGLHGAWAERTSVTLFSPI